MRNSGDQPIGSAIRPAILLEDADDIHRFSRVDGDAWFNLRIDVVGVRPTHVTTSEGAWTRDQRKGGAGMDQGSPSHGQDHYKDREGSDDPETVYVTHEILLEGILSGAIQRTFPS